jgi:replicative DNA helicase
MRQPPRSLEAEVGLLGSCLIDSDALSVATDILPRDFSKPTNGVVWKAIKTIADRGDVLDIVSVGEELVRTNELEDIGGYTALHDLVSQTPTSANVSYYAASVRTKATLRRILAAAAKISEIAYADPADADEALDRVEAEIYAVARTSKRNDFTGMRSLVDDAISRLDWIRHNRGSGYGVGSGLAALDEMTSGFQPSDLTILAARPSVGKTAMAINIAQHAAIKEGKRVAIFSLEMSRDQLATRLMAGASGVDIFRIRRGDVEGVDLARIATAVAHLEAASIFIDDSPVASPVDLRSKARRLAADGGLDLIIVDYLQLMMPTKQTKEGNRVVETSDISRGLKAMARELNVPVIALSQLSRAAEHREGGQPRLADLRDSGAIEQDADLVMLLWRPNGQEHGQAQERVKLSLAKHRNGPTGEIDLTFVKATTTFLEGDTQ